MSSVSRSLKRAWVQLTRLWLYPTTGTNESQRKALNLVWWDGVLSTASVAFINDFVPIYMMALGASSTLIGLRSSVNSAVALIAPMLGALFVARTGKRKLWVLLGGGGLGRIALILMALIPFVANGETAVYLFLGLFALKAFADAFTGPPWNSLLGDICPMPIRGRFLGSRMVANNIATVMVIPLAGWLIGKIGGLEGYQTVWLIAALVGFGATITYAGVPEPKAAEAGQHRKGSNLKAAWRIVSHDKNYLWFCTTHFIWNIGIQIGAPYFTVHMVQDLGFSVENIAMLSTIATVVNILALRVAGELVDKKGAPLVAAVSMLVVPLLPFLWIFPKGLLGVGLVQAYGALAWSGFRVADAPIILMLAPDAYRSDYVAIRTTTDQLGTIIGPIIAALLYSQYGFTANMIGSGTLRAAGALMFLSLLLRGVFKDKDDSGARLGRRAARLRRAH